MNITEIPIKTEDFKKLVDYVNSLPTIHGRPIANFLDKILMDVQKQMQERDNTKSEEVPQKTKKLTKA